jgi:hypothetical protein
MVKVGHAGIANSSESEPVNSVASALGKCKTDSSRR